MSHGDLKCRVADIGPAKRGGLRDFCRKSWCGKYRQRYEVGSEGATTASATSMLMVTLTELDWFVGGLQAKLPSPCPEALLRLGVSSCPFPWLYVPLLPFFIFSFPCSAVGTIPLIARFLC